jgi:hypothetical protein
LSRCRSSQLLSTVPRSVLALRLAKRPNGRRVGPWPASWRRSANGSGSGRSPSPPGAFSVVASGRDCDMARVAGQVHWPGRSRRWFSRKSRRATRRVGGACRRVSRSRPRRSPRAPCSILPATAAAAGVSSRAVRTCPSNQCASPSLSVPICTTTLLRRRCRVACARTRIGSCASTTFPAPARPASVGSDRHEEGKS